MKPYKTVLIPLSKLKEHPEQALLVRPLDDATLRELARKMEADPESVEPVDVLPNDTLIDGSQRKRAAELLGWEKIRARVRTDLADDPDAATLYLVESGLLRNQHDPISRTRLALRRLELTEGVPPGGLSYADMSRLDEYLAKALGVSERHAKRLRRIVMTTPTSVHHFVSDGKLRIEWAERLANMQPGPRSEVIAAIEGGQEPNEAVSSRLGVARRGGLSPSQRLEQLMVSLQRHLLALEGRESSLRPPARTCDRYLDLLNRFEIFAASLRTALTTVKARLEAAAARMQAGRTETTTPRSDRPKRPR